jgi:hypothetical protein
MKELQEKAQISKETGLVSVIDVTANIVKSDTIIPEEFDSAIKSAVHALEDVPEKDKDWHPGSNGQVLDLVHPSLFPLVYGKTKILPTGTVPLEECIGYSGKGEVIPSHDENDSMEIDKDMSWGNSSSLKAWGEFQWLPSDIHFTDDGGCKIVSYVNNLHPKKHKNIYKLLEKFVEYCIPLWNQTLTFPQRIERIIASSEGDEDFYVPEGKEFPGLK